MSGRLDTAEYERAKSFLHEIVVDLLPNGTQWTDGARGWRQYEHSHGLSVNLSGNCWHRFSDDASGYSPVHLISLIKSEYSLDDARSWLAAFLSAHPGTGSGAAAGDVDDGDDADDIRARINAEVARDIEARIVPVESGTAVERYIHGRGIAAYPPDALFCLRDARVGEDALVVRLEAHGRTVAYLATFVTPLGFKSRVLPQRRRFNLERSRSAVFRLPPPPQILTGPIDRTADFCAAEGVENALSLWQIGRPWTVLGIPGIGFLGDIDLPKGSRLTFVKDGDPPDSPAARGLIQGVDSQLLKGVTMRVTPTGDDEDPNQVLRIWGPDVLSALVMQAKEASLSFDGRIRGLVRLDAGVAFEQERAAIAKIFKVRVGAVDDAVKRLRPRPAAPKDAGEVGDSEPVFVPDEPWTAPVDLAAVLNAIYAELGRYIWQPETGATVASVWSALTHIVHNPRVNLQVCSKLHITSSLPDCGKTVLLELLGELVHRGMLAGSYSGSRHLSARARDAADLVAR